MRRPAAHRQRVKKVLLALLLLPLAGLGVWLLFSASGDSGREASRASRTLVESSSTLRGNIYDRNFDTLALSFRLSSLYARPLEIAEPDETAAALSRILDLNREELLDSLRSERSFVWLTRQAEKGAVESVLEGNFRGVYLMPRSYRYYPHRAAGAAHAVGFVKDEQGLAGIELAYDNILRGGVADAWLTAAGLDDQGAGGRKAHLVTTLDLQIQSALEQRLGRATRSVDGRAASALLMDVNSGAILAMVSLPSYDPNLFWAFSAEERTNLSVVPQVRLGALRELFRLAAALEQEPGGGPVSGSGDSGFEQQGVWHRLEPGLLASTELRNIAAARLPALVPEEFLQRIGLCGPVELDLLEGRTAAEFDLANGSELKSRREEVCRRLSTEATESRVSGVALLGAFGRLVNGGRPLEPHLVQGLWDGERLQATKAAAAEPPAAGAGRNFTQALALLNAEEGERPVAIFESLVALRPEEGPERAAAGSAPGRYQAVLLGLDSVRQPSLAVLMFIDQARLDPLLPSPLAGVARELPAWSERWRHPVAPPSAAAMVQREAALYRQWLATQAAADFPGSVGGSPVAERMPNVLGQSLRKALQTLQVTGLRFQIHGSGQVVAQHPAPGVPLKGLEEGIIELRAAERVAAYGGRR